MLTQYYYKCYELDLQKIMNYTLDYNGNRLKTLLATLYISVASAHILL